MSGPVAGGAEELPLLPDETLEDGPQPVPEEPALRRELIEQRFVHGLLRAMHGADATSREARMQSILAELPPEVGATPSRGRLLLWAAAVVLATAGALWIMPRGDGLPRAEAMVEQALRELSRPVDHRYAIELELRSRDGYEGLRRSYTLTVRPERHFLLRGEGMIGTFDVGSDGETLWCRPPLAVMRWSKPDRRSKKHGSRSEKLGTLLTRSDVESSDVDLHGLLDGLNEKAKSISVRRTPARREGGGSLIRVEARDFDVDRAKKKKLARSIQLVALEVDEATGALDRVEVVRRPVPNWELHFTFHYQGTVELDEKDYRRPW